MSEWLEFLESGGALALLALVLVGLGFLGRSFAQRVFDLLDVWLARFHQSSQKQADAVQTMAAKVDKAVEAQNESLIVLRVISRQNDEQTDNIERMRQSQAEMAEALTRLGERSAAG